MSATTDQPKKPEVSQKEYLKRYLSKDKGQKKKKKKVKISSSSYLKPSIIVDDDLGLPDIASIEDEEFNLEYLGDEAPQIAGVIDERPPEIKAKENYGDRNKWKSIGEPEDGECSTESNPAKLVENRNHNITNGKSLLVDSNKYVDSDNSSLKNKIKSTSKENKPYKERRISRNSDSDVSPTRSKSKNKDKGKNSVKKRYSSDEDSDVSPPRSKIKDAEKDHFSKRASRHDESLLSSSRSKSHRKESSQHYDRDREKHRTAHNEHGKKRSHKGSDSDLSPPRRSKYEGKSRRYKGESDSDLSPPRKSKYEEKSKKKEPSYDSNFSSSRRNKYDGKVKRNDSDSDQSLPRKNRNEGKMTRNGSDSDLSPPRKNRYEGRTKRKESDSDLSPPRKKRSGEKIKRNGNDSDLSPPRKEIYKRRPTRKGSDSDLSPPRKSKHEKIKKSMDKTLDGKKAGLQDARNLKEELKNLKEAENAMFEKMKASVSGKSAMVVMRDRKTGKIRDLNKEKEEQSKKSVKAAERESKYAKWGRGLKQVAEAEDRVTDYLHEVNKPLARYAGDADLEKILKARELQEDPMLDYIRNKQSESIDVEVKGKPSYRGYYLPNRFNIRPGHRWDGVDRSNGYEKQWFERKNAKKALEEEAYKWSTADM